MPTANLTSLTNAVLSGTSPQDCVKNLIDGKQQCYFSILGQTPNGVKGGATLTFKGNGDCWPRSCLLEYRCCRWQSRPSISLCWYWKDDGDIDLFAGLSTYYMISCIEIGDFNGVYTDSLGSSVEIEYNELPSLSIWCDERPCRPCYTWILYDLANREGVEYTTVLDLFRSTWWWCRVLVSLYWRKKFEINECTLFGESQKAERDSEGAVVKDENGLIKPYTRACTKQLERASCTDKLTEFCCIYPDMCGEDAKEFACLGVEETASEICTAGHELNYLCCGS